MERHDQDALIETAIATAMSAEGMVGDDDLISGFVVVASFQADDGTTRLAYWIPEHQAPHASIGMLTLVESFVRRAQLVD